MFRLYDYFRSSASFRVRIALNLKEQPFESIPVHLIKDGGQQHQEAYRKVHPHCLVPTLEEADTHALLHQSLAIIEYLEERFPTPALLPHDALERARIRAFALAIACDIHPLNNLRVLHYLTQTLSVSEEQKMTWYHHWLSVGLEGLERSLTSQGPFCFGDSPTLADVCLIPQIYNAIRFQHPLERYPQLQAIYQNCIIIPAFELALPENQLEGG